MGGAGGGKGANVLEQTLDIVTNLATAGIAGYNKDKGFGFGASTHAVDEGIGEISGRNLMREQMAKEETAVAAEQAQRAKELQDQRTQAELRDRAASGTAAALRNGAAQAMAVPGQVKSIKLGSDNQDYLGL